MKQVYELDVCKPAEKLSGMVWYHWLQLCFMEGKVAGLVKSIPDG